MESKSARMRQLFAQGKSVSEVAKLVGVEYQFAYGVAKRAGFLEPGAALSRQQRRCDGHARHEDHAGRVWLGPCLRHQLQVGFGTAFLGESSLMRIGRFYRENTEVIERFRVPTLDFDSGAETDRKYPRAKVIDMIFFIEGGATA